VGSKLRNETVQRHCRNASSAAFVASGAIDLTDEEASRLEHPYTPRNDFQGISDDAELSRISAKIGIKPAGS
jgi:hypothetical protein